MRPYIFKLMDAARDEAARFSAWVKARGLAADDAWITVQSNGGGRHVLLGDDGTIKSGMGGKFNGQRIDLIPRKPKAPPDANAIVKLPSTRYNIPRPAGGGGTMRTGNNESAQRTLSVFKDQYGLTEQEINNFSQEVRNAAKHELKQLEVLSITTRGKIERAEKKGDIQQAEQERLKLKDYEQRTQIIQELADKASGKSPETTREDYKKIVDSITENPKYQELFMDAFDVRSKNYAIPDSQERISFPPKVVSETEKAYKIRSTNPNGSAVSLTNFDFVPKSRVTMKDGHIVGVEGWLKKKMTFPVD